MNNIEQPRRDQQIQHGVERLHRRPNAITRRHVEQNLHRLLDPTAQVAVNPDDITEELVGEPTVPLVLDPVDDNLDVVEQAGVGELVDEQGEEGFGGFVVLAVGVVVEGGEDGVGILEG